MWRSISLAAVLLVVLAVALVQPAQAEPLAQANVIWNAEYYNNPNLQGSPAVRRQDQAIAFDWGHGSPASGINADNFSARWGTDVYLPAGTYRFFALADDEVRVIVDFQFHPLIDTFGQGKVNQLVWADITLAAGLHHIQVDYREQGGTAFVFVSFANAANNPQPNFPALNLPVPVTPGQWTAQYFANRDLAGSPTLIQSESQVTRDWGEGSPAPSIPGDNWSARWTTVQNLPAGNYEIMVRADDGVRVFVDGLAVINEWHTATGLTYTNTLYLTAGPHSFLVEFFEAGGVAFIDFQVRQLTSVQPTPIVPVVPVIPSPTGQVATVTASRLNVRDQPNPFTGRIINIISRNQTYPVLGANENNTWVQLDVNGQIGWVNANYVRLSGADVATPTPVPQIPGSSGYSATAYPYAVNIRSGPGTQHGVIARLPLNASAPIIGRNFDSTWWQINYNGIVGWVSAPYARIQQGADVSRIPVTG
ncbi:MAG: PA14 domain-containing protein [Chloroflexota bacterium]|nr:MAG: hypothetical protein DIU68_07790 [Chloroflexota bacterium]